MLVSVTAPVLFSQTTLQSLGCLQAHVDSKVVPHYCWRMDIRTFCARISVLLWFL